MFIVYYSVRTLSKAKIDKDNAILQRESSTKPRTNTSKRSRGKFLFSRSFHSFRKKIKTLIFQLLAAIYPSKSFYICLSCVLLCDVEIICSLNLCYYSAHRAARATCRRLYVYKYHIERSHEWRKRKKKNKKYRFSLKEFYFSWKSARGTTNGKCFLA